MACPSLCWGFVYGCLSDGARNDWPRAGCERSWRNLPRILCLKLGKHMKRHRFPMATLVPRPEKSSFLQFQIPFSTTNDKPDTISQAASTAQTSLQHRYEPLSTAHLSGPRRTLTAKSSGISGRAAPPRTAILLTLRGRPR